MVKKHILKNLQFVYCNFLSRMYFYFTIKSLAIHNYNLSLFNTRCVRGCSFLNSITGHELIILLENPPWHTFECYKIVRVLLAVTTFFCVNKCVNIIFECVFLENHQWKYWKSFILYIFLLNKSWNEWTSYTLKLPIAFSKMSYFIKIFRKKRFYK